jgi:hypothetical protein
MSSPCLQDLLEGKCDSTFRVRIPGTANTSLLTKQTQTIKCGGERNMSRAFQDQFLGLTAGHEYVHASVYFSVTASHSASPGFDSLFRDRLAS